MPASKSKTVSTSAAEADLGTHVFHIVGYSQQKAICDHKCPNIMSGGFSVGGHEWAMALTPDINSIGHPDCIPIMLMLMSTVATGVRASFEMRLVNQSTGLPFTVHKEAPTVFDDSSDIADVWIKRSLVESPTYLWNDRLTVECIVTVIKEPRAPKTKSLPRIDVPPSNMAEQFGTLLETGLGVDVTFSVGAQTFTAHKIVLATWSPVFKAELYGPMKEEGMGPITIKDMQPEVFRALLHFMYTDSLPSLDDLQADDHIEMICHLLVAADRYAIERLKLICQSFLCENLNVQTVATTLALADQHNCDILKEACIEFITCSNLMDYFLSTHGYKNLKKNCPAVVMDAFEKTSKFRKA